LREQQSAKEIEALASGSKRREETSSAIERIRERLDERTRCDEAQLDTFVSLLNEKKAEISRLRSQLKTASFALAESEPRAPPAKKRKPQLAAAQPRQQSSKSSRNVSSAKGSRSQTQRSQTKHTKVLPTAEESLNAVLQQAVPGADTEQGTGGGTVDVDGRGTGRATSLGSASKGGGTPTAEKASASDSDDDPFDLI